MKNKEKTEIVIPSGYILDELLDLDGDLWDEKPIGVEEVRIRFEAMNKKARRMTGLRRRESSSWTPFSKTWKTVSGFGNRGGRAEVRRYRRSRVSGTTA